MHKSFACLQGHQWEVTVGGPTPVLDHIVCPVCGAAAETVRSQAPPAVPGTDTGAPTPRSGREGAAAG